MEILQGDHDSISFLFSTMAWDNETREATEEEHKMHSPGGKGVRFASQPWLRYFFRVLF